MARGQIAVEFSFMVLMAFLFLGVVLIVTSFYLTHYTDERAIAGMEDLASSVQQELLLATAVEDGYRRGIELPERIAGRPYVVANTATTLTLSLEDGTNYNAELPPVSGYFIQGGNVIRKRDGIIHVNEP